MLSGRHRKWLVGVVMVVASIAGLWNLSNQIVSNDVCPSVLLSCFVVGYRRV